MSRIVASGSMVFDYVKYDDVTIVVNGDSNGNAVSCECADVFIQEVFYDIIKSKEHYLYDVIPTKRGSMVAAYAFLLHYFPDQMIKREGNIENK